MWGNLCFLAWLFNWSKTNCPGCDTWIQVRGWRKGRTGGWLLAWESIPGLGGSTSTSTSTHTQLPRSTRGCSHRRGSEILQPRTWMVWGVGRGGGGAGVGIIPPLQRASGRNSVSSSVPWESPRNRDATTGPSREWVQALVVCEWIFLKKHPPSKIPALPPPTHAAAADTFAACLFECCTAEPCAKYKISLISLKSFPNPAIQTFNHFISKLSLDMPFLFKFFIQITLPINKK